MKHSRSYKLQSIFLLCVFSSSSFPSPTSPASDLKWGNVEFVSIQQDAIDKKYLLVDYPIKISQAVTNDSMLDVIAWCEEKLRKRVAPKELGCTIVMSSETNSVQPVLTISNVKNKNSPSPNSQELLLNYRLIKKYDKIKGCISQLSNNQENPEVIRQSQNKKYYIGFNNKKLDDEAKQFFSTLAPHKLHLIDVLLNDADDDERNRAEFLLGWAGLDNEDMAWILEGLSKKASVSTYNLLKLLIRFPILIESRFEDETLEKVQSLFFSVNYQVRLNSLIITNRLLKKNKNLREKIRPEAADFIKYIYNSTRLTEFKVPAEFFLEEIKVDYKTLL